VGGRLTGGGFGGSVVMFAKEGEAQRTAENIISKATSKLKFSPRII
jgi:galactokinase